MNVLIVYSDILPPTSYGGTQRVVWSLLKALYQLKHNVHIISPASINCSWITSIKRDLTRPLAEQIPEHIDVVHFHSQFEEIPQPYVITQHGNTAWDKRPNPNTIFVSKKHALNHASTAFVHNGLDWSDYLKPNLNIDNRQDNFHFLGNAAWRLKNVQGAISITRKAKTQLHVLGGHRLNFKMGFRLTLDRHVKFHGMVDNQEKSSVLQQSKGLVFPVTWEEPFGLAITESLFMGCPVFATPYGSLPEIINHEEFGFLSNKESDLVQALNEWDYQPKVCHEYANDQFNHILMAQHYLAMYEKVINGEALNNMELTPLKEKKNLTYIRS